MIGVRAAYLMMLALSVGAVELAPSWAPAWSPMPRAFSRAPFQPSRRSGGGWGYSALEGHRARHEARLRNPALDRLVAEIEKDARTVRAAAARDKRARKAARNRQLAAAGAIGTVGGGR